MHLADARRQWIGDVSKYGHLHGLKERPGWKEEPLELRGFPPRLLKPCDIWTPYALPICDQKESGMCESFSTSIGLSTALRKKVDFWLFSEDRATAVDDCCHDPRPGHLAARQRYAPAEVYTRAEGVPSTFSMDGLKEANLVSPGTRARQIPWDDVPYEIWNGPILLPMGVWDGWQPNALSGRSEVGEPIDPLQLYGGHQTCGIRTFQAADGEWMIGAANSWIRWGYHGYYSIRLSLAKRMALDKPAVIEVTDPEWYRDTVFWRDAIVTKAELNKWLSEPEAA